MRSKAPLRVEVVSLPVQNRHSKARLPSLQPHQPPAPFVQPEDKQVDAALVARCHAAGLKMQVWTVNDAARMQALLDLGVDGMFTDDPKTLKGLLKP